MRPEIRRRIWLAGVAASHTVHRRARLVMWTAIAGASALFGVLLALGLSSAGALGTAAGALLLACIATCVWAWTSQERMWKRALHDLRPRRAGPVASEGNEPHALPASSDTGMG